MAGVRISCDTGEEAITGTETLGQVKAATNQRIRVERIRVSGKGISATDFPVLFEVLTQTGAGTLSTMTVNKLNEDDGETVQTTALKDFSAEPTPGIVKASQLIHPQTSYDFVFPPGRDLYVNGNDRLGVRAVSPAQNGTFAVHFEMEE